MRDRWMAWLAAPTLLAVALAGEAPAGAAPAGGETPPVAVFAELDGTWEGSFVGYDLEGRELYRLRVRQTYRTVDAHTQQVEIEDTAGDGTVVTGRGVNTARRRPDGTLELTCRVVKSNGETVEHAGRLVRGPAGAEEIVWHSRGPERAEIFREAVHRQEGRTIYSIDGLGRYGESLVLMAGRYRKVESRPGDP